MTDMEKKVLMRICTKIVAETELYVTISGNAEPDRLGLRVGADKEE